MKAELLTMFGLQNQINTKIAADWKECKFDWHRAIWVEAGELQDHIGYKWWKHQETDFEQSHLELVDIMHFGISLLMMNDPDKSIEEIVDEIVPSFDLLGSDYTGNVLESVDSLAGRASLHKEFAVPEFVECMKGLNMTFDDLFRGYVCKNVLNTFRQDKGYKEGTYTKHWDGKEDNEHLMDVYRDNQDLSDRENFPELIYIGLEEKYPVS